MNAELDDLAKALADSSWGEKADALRMLTAKLAAGEIDEEREAALFGLIVAAASDPKWELRKAAAVALSELRHADGAIVQKMLEALGRDQQTHYVKEAAERALKRIRSRAQRQKQWKLTEDTRDPTLQHIMTRIRQIGLRSMTPARIYELAMEVSEQSYREVAADTAHEMRNLMTPFEGYLVEIRRHLSADGEIDDASARYIALAFTRLEHIKLLIDNLRIYSTPTDADFAPVTLESLVRQAVGIGCDRGDHGSHAGITQVVELPPDIVVDALPDRLVRAIANLVANACQAMEAGGTLTVRAVVTNGDRLELSIRDTGEGMSPEQIDQARLRFRSSRRDEGGTGLGLPIAERIIVNDHQGELTIESMPREGTTITITLPLRQRTVANQ